MNWKNNLYLRPRFYWSFFAIVFVFALSFGFVWLYVLGQVLLVVLLGLFLLELWVLFSIKSALVGSRKIAEKLSNGDLNEVQLHLESRYAFQVFVEIIDEVPFQFQERSLSFQTEIAPQGAQKIIYQLRPTSRGVYEFGLLNVYAWSQLGLIARRFRLAAPQAVAVYPSFLQMKQYEFLAISNRLTEAGIKKIRKIGHNLEFEQVKEYVMGDDIRSINWKATARRSELMVNQYQDEKSQAVYCIIDKGRAMKMPFEGLTLLDYAINASLVMLNIALLKQDKAGLVTFDHKIRAQLAARSTSAQRQSILELLYREKTRYTEADFSQLSIYTRTQIKQRSLLILFTNFEASSSMQRQLPYLRQIAKYHLVLLVIFENTALDLLLQRPSKSTEEIYIQTLAEEFVHEKKLIVKELNQYGIHTLLTKPQNLTVNTLNKYLEFKARGLI